MAAGTQFRTADKAVAAGNPKQDLGYESLRFGVGRRGQSRLESRFHEEIRGREPAAAQAGTLALPRAEKACVGGYRSGISTARSMRVLTGRDGKSDAGAGMPGVFFSRVVKPLYPVTARDGARRAVSTDFAVCANPSEVVFTGRDACATGQMR